VFNISVLFLAILIAQLEQSFDELTKEAHVNVIVRKTEGPTALPARKVY